MQLRRTLVGLSLLISSVGAVDDQAGQYVGYLISTFTDKNPTVQWYLSRGNDPGTYSFLNQGKPILQSTVGTKAVRDVFLATNSERNQWFMIGTGKMNDALYDSFTNRSYERS
jgi:hypothetical protein